MTPSPPSVWELAPTLSSGSLESLMCFRQLRLLLFFLYIITLALGNICLGPPTSLEGPFLQLLTFRFLSQPGLWLLRLTSGWPNLPVDFLYGPTSTLACSAQQLNLSTPLWKSCGLQFGRFCCFSSPQCLKSWASDDVLSLIVFRQPGEFLGTFLICL